MTSAERAAMRIRARMTLVESAREARDKGETAADWCATAIDSEPGELLGAREVDSVMRMVFGIGGTRMFR